MVGNKNKFWMETIFIGIDPGTETGIGYKIPEGNGVKSLKIHNAMVFVNYLVANYPDRPVFIRVEDARKRKKFGANSTFKQQGAGSIKRDCKIWEDFLKDLQKQYPGRVEVQFLHPIKGGTKMPSGVFRRTTGITGRTNNHERDAYMLIHDFKP